MFKNLSFKVRLNYITLSIICSCIKVTNAMEETAKSGDFESRIKCAKTYFTNKEFYECNQLLEQIETDARRTYDYKSLERLAMLYENGDGIRKNPSKGRALQQQASVLERIQSKDKSTINNNNNKENIREEDPKSLTKHDKASYADELERAKVHFAKKELYECNQLLEQIETNARKTRDYKALKHLAKLYENGDGIRKNPSKGKALQQQASILKRNSLSGNSSAKKIKGHDSFGTDHQLARELQERELQIESDAEYARQLAGEYGGWNPQPSYDDVLPPLHEAKVNEAKVNEAKVTQNEYMPQQKESDEGEKEKPNIPIFQTQSRLPYSDVRSILDDKKSY